MKRRLENSSDWNWTYYVYIARYILSPFQEMYFIVSKLTAPKNSITKSLVKTAEVYATLT